MAPVEKQQCIGLAAHDTSGVLQPFTFERRTVGPDDVRIKITHCGICHSDLHMIKGEWGNTTYPVVPGHEIVGIVEEVGANVKDFQVGDRAGVGCMVDSCRECAGCRDGQEQLCEKGMIQTYNWMNPKDGLITRGGYSQYVVVDKSYTLRIPENLPMDAAAPLLCAGITTYSPLRYYGIDKPGMKLGVVGLGGLGHMAVKLGKAMGMEVTVLSRSDAKKDEAVKRLNADNFVVSKDEQQMKAAEATLDGIIDTVSAQHDIGALLPLLKPNGKLVLVGAPPEALPVAAFGLIMGRKLLGGSIIGGIKETQEMLDFCAKHNVTCDIEKIDCDYVNKAMERLAKSDVHYRFVIDMSTMKA